MVKPGNLHILMVKVFHGHFKKSRSALSKEDITSGQPRILNWLWENDGCIQKEIAVNTNLEPATITSVLSNMERNGLVRREFDTRDRRITTVWLTDKGREYRKKMWTIFEQLEKEVFEGFSEAEKEQMMNYLERMHENIKKYKYIQKGDS